MSPEKNTEEFKVISFQESGKSKRQLADVMSEALFDDPFSEYVFADTKVRKKLLSAFYGIFIHFSLKNGFIDVLVDTKGDIVGGAAWMGPQKPIPNPALFILYMFTHRTIGIIFTLGLYKIKRLLDFGDEVEKIHKEMKEPHYYLSLLGVLPSHQRKGLGGKLLQDISEKAENENIPLYLESTNPLNLSFYTKTGFETRVLKQLDQGPLIRVMTR